MIRIYLASPLGFATSTRPFMHELVQAVERFAHVENPWAFGTIPKEEREKVNALTDRHEYAARMHELNHRIAAANEAAIRRSDAMVAVLDGVDVDSGTASEIGFAYGLGKRIWGLRTDFRQTGENPGAIVNLQVQYWIEASGGTIVTTTEDLLKALGAGAN